MKTLLRPKIDVYSCRVSYPWGRGILGTQEYKKVSINPDIIIPIMRRYCYLGFDITIKRDEDKIWVTGVFLSSGEISTEYWHLKNNIWKYEGVTKVNYELPVYF